MKTQVPFFPGFYETILDSFMDQEIENEMENKDLEYDDIVDRLDYNAARKAIAEKWVEAFGEELGINLEFTELWSPREYNFTTDKVYAEISEEAMNFIYKKVKGNPELPQILKEWFTTRDGFISYYSNDLDDWKDKKIEDMDDIERSVYIAAYAISMYDKDELMDTLYNTCSVYEAAQHIWIS